MTSPFQPIAIIGLGCRFPGGCDDPQQFWQLLLEGRDAISETPESRWNLNKFYAAERSRIGKTHSKWGGYVEGIDQFDPDLFGISPREAACMDPQQRLLLETAFRATEDAGVPIESLAGENVSVHVGISSFDYAVAGLSFRDRGVIGPYSNTGGSSSIAANRISYCFDLRGESVAVDTACSSSLIATHLACRSLQDPTNRMALAGGVNALLLPDFYVAFSQLGVLSPDGRCKTFDASANGYVRSEGAGMLLMKRLDDAIADGDAIYAVIRGSATNQDGRTDGMTVPSEHAQRKLIQTALQSANVDPADVSYVEAHGTGTPVGDPIEARAIASCYGRSANSNAQARTNQPCYLGSVKTNIGHLEAGAGVASIIKVALAMRHSQIPAHLNLNEPNPQIDFRGSGLVVPQQTLPWQSSRERLAGINGFGYGGANVHLILSEAPRSAPKTRSARQTSSDHQQVPLRRASTAAGAISHRDGEELPLIMPLSAHSKAALAATAQDWVDWLESRDDDSITHDDLKRIASAVATRRSQMDWRSCVVGKDVSEWIESLYDIANESDANIRQVHTSLRRRKLSDDDATPELAFVFSGQGPQWWAMGRGLLNSNPTFRRSIEQADREFAKYVSWSLLEELQRDESTSRMNETSIAQPSIFALQVALAAVWKSQGVHPTVVIGHSVGEIAAAHLSGGLSFADAACVAVHRGRTMDAASSRGAMIAVGLSQQEAESWIKPLADRVSIAAINGPTSLTISGCDLAIEQLQKQLDAKGVFCRRLQVEYAFHSPQMDPVRDPLMRSLANIVPGEIHTPMISTVTGEFIDGAALGAEYWWRNVRESVRFADAMNELAGTKTDLIVEVGPHPVLTYSITECFAKHQRNVECVPSLRHEKEFSYQDDMGQMARSLASLYCWGYPVTWLRDDANSAIPMGLPKLAMVKQTLWSESYESRRTRLSDGGTVFLGDRLDGPTDNWESRIDLRTIPSLADHRVRHSCVLPAAAMLTIAASAAKQLGDEDGTNAALRRFRMHNPCLLDDSTPVRLQTRYDQDRRRIEMFRSGVDDSEWQLLSTVDVSTTAASPLSHAINPDQLREQLAEYVPADRLYRHCETLGLNYGRRFRGVVDAWRQDQEALVSIDLSLKEENDDQLGPALLDSCFHGMIVADPDFDHTVRGLYLPQQIASIDVFADLSPVCHAHVRILHKDDYRMVADIDVYDADDQHVIAIRGFESVCVTGTGQKESIEDLLYQYVWQPATSVGSKVESDLDRRKWLLFSDQSGMAERVTHRFSIDDQVVTIQHGTSFKRLDRHSFIIDPENRDHFDRLLTDIGDGVTDVVYLWGLDCPDNAELSDEVLAKSSLLTTLAPLHFVGAWQAAAEADRQTTIARFCVVTRDAQPPDEATVPISVAAGPLIGFTRVVAGEVSRLKTKLVDLTSTDPTVHENLLDELLLRIDDEDEVLYRDAIRWVRRFNPCREQSLHRESKATTPAVLRRGKSASIGQLHYQSCVASDLKPTDVEIEVIATGLNFSDVMKSLDLYPGLPDGPVIMGAECSGRIRRVGSAVNEFNIGDEVIAVAPGSFASHVVVGSDLVAMKPAGMPHEQAATVPIAFLTAEYALNECARIRKGERVLIHSASGGVGIAAMQLAKLAGAEIFATAGSDEKRAYVAEAGAAYVMNSRDLSWANEIPRQTDGQGIDVILNSLPGEAIAKGLSVLRTGGRFLEIGKRDIYSDAPLGLEPFRNNLAMFAIDLDQLFREQPERMGRMLRDMVGRFESGQLTPLPTQNFSADETRDAFRYMQQGKHIGKVVVDYRGGIEEVFAGEVADVNFKADRTYWIAGGLGGFGLRVAQWLVDSGAKHLVLGGRSKEVPAQTAMTLDRWRDEGVSVRVLPVDLTSMASVQSVVDEIDANGPALAGVFHTAMILEDRLLADLDPPTLTRVLRPKVQGGWNLHAATSDHDLDCFVLFSSLSSVFGHAGQANYSAANAFLDSLAHYRRSLGMPGLAINWGHVGEVGYLAERSELSERLQRQGVLTFSADEAMQCLNRSIGTDAIQLSVLRMDWSVWRGLGITGSVSPRFAHLLRGQNNNVSGLERLATAEEVRSADGPARRELIAGIVGSKAATLLGIELGQMEWDQPLLSMGLDSLMAVELRNWIESRLEINLSIADLMRGEGLNQVCHAICEVIDGNAPSSEPIERDTLDPDNSSNELLNQLSDMTDETVDALLAQLIDESQSGSSGG